jgi:hypothetical protein
MRKNYIITVALALALGAICSFAAQTADLVGTWEVTTVSPEGTRTHTMVVSKDGDGLKAVAKSPNGERPYDSAELKGTAVTLVLTISYNGAPMVITYTGRLDQGALSGDADFGGLATGTWSAKRQ